MLLGFLPLLYCVMQHFCACKMSLSHRKTLFLQILKQGLLKYTYFYIYYHIYTDVQKP